VLARGGHFAFLPVCTAEGLRALATIAADVCGQRVSVDRVEVHRRVEAEALESPILPSWGRPSRGAFW